MKQYEQGYSLVKFIHKVAKRLKGGFMKKFLMSLLLILLAFQIPAFAARTSVNTLISSTTLDADPTSASGTYTVKSADKVAFFVSYDETETGGIQVAVTADISADGTTWFDASFYDYAGGATLQTSETLTTDSSYYFWMDPNLAFPYVRVVITATGSDADDTAIVSAKIVTQE